MSIEASESRQVGSRPDNGAANLHRDAYKPDETPHQAPSPTVPAEFPQLTIVNGQTARAEAPQQPSPGAEDTPLRRFCNRPIPLIPAPNGLAECEQEIKFGNHAQDALLGAQVGIVKGVYDVGNGAIKVLDGGLSPMTRLGNFLANAIVNPQLAMHDAGNWGNDTGKAMVGATRAYLTMSNYSLQVSKAEWQGDFLKEPRDGVNKAIDAAKAFAKQPPGKQAESIGEQSISMMLPMAADKVVAIVPQLAENVVGLVGSMKGAAGQPQLELAVAGTGKLPEVRQTSPYMPQTSGLRGDGAGKAGEDTILKMMGRGASVSTDLFAQSITNLRQKLLELHGKPLAEKLEGLEKINRDLIKQEQQMPIEDRRRAKALAAGLQDVSNRFQSQALELIEQVKALKPKVEAIGSKEKLTEAEEKFLSQYRAQEDTVCQLVRDRLKQVYGWDEKSSGMPPYIISRSEQEGFETQNRVNGEMSNLLNQGLDRNPLVKEILKAKGISVERAKDWVGIPTPEGSAADQAGCDYLLVNKSSGEMYAFDVTQKVVNMRHGRTADSLLVNKNLVFDTSEKSIPTERKGTVIGAAGEGTINDMAYRLKNERGLSKADARREVDLAEEKQLAEIIATTISQPSQLNIFATRLPSANPFANLLVQQYELQQFQADLNNLGHDDWARTLGAAIGYIRYKQSNSLYY